MIKRLNITYLLFLLTLALAGKTAQAKNKKLPIIDIHLHSYSAKLFYPRKDMFGRNSSSSASTHFEETYQAMRKHNVVLGAFSGSKESGKTWISKDVDGRLLRGLNRPQEWTVKEFEEAVKNGEIKVFGEIGLYYAGKTLDDPFYVPYLKICEQYGIPVAVHTGGGPPRTPYGMAPNARLKYGNPLLLEDALIKYPKLKIYLMHAGSSFYEEALSIMLMHPRVYADLGVVLWVHEKPKHHGEEFLKLAKRYGMLDRVMFGSVQMMWPHAIEDSINQLNSFDFLSEKEKRNIFYHNAARFLQLSDEEIARHHMN